MFNIIYKLLSEFHLLHHQTTQHHTLVESYTNRIPFLFFPDTIVDYHLVMTRVLLPAFKSALCISTALALITDLITVT